MRDHKLSPLGQLLGGSLARYGIGERVTAAQIVTSANKLLQEILTADQAREVVAVSFKSSELCLACKTPTARFAAEGLAKTLSHKLEELYPEQTISRIICVFRTPKATEDEWYNDMSV